VVRSLPVTVQQSLLEEGRALHAELLDWTKNFYNEGVHTWKEQTKDCFVELTTDQRAAFRQRLEGVDQQVAAQVPGLKEWLDLLRTKAKQHAE
jgi:hypothetical protein